jgi:hypothetical protein
VAIIGRVSPNALGTGTVASDVFDFSKWRRVVAVLATGDVGNNGTVQVAAYAVAANAASGGTVIPGKAFSAATFSGSGSGTAGGSYHEGIVEVTDIEAKAALNTARYGYFTLTVGAATSDATLLILGIDARNEPASANNLGSVVEIVS